ncbi:MAG: hypothetical protein OEY28_14160 [Nitrospira sp.]|nr:hypothetical protein [Nitrospira sp.]
MASRTLTPLRVVACLFCAASLLALAGSGPGVSGASETRWVAVMEDSPDALLLDSPDRWGEPVTTLKFNERVTFLSGSEKDLFHHISIRRSRKTVKGYVKANVLATQSQYQGSKKEAEAGTAVGAEAANTASKGLNSQNERTLSSNDPKFKAAVAKVDEIERTIDGLIFGDPDQPDPGKALENYKRYGREGGLIEERGAGK